MFDIPESDIVGVRVDEETVKINKNPEYIRARPTNSVEDQPDDTSATLKGDKTEKEHENKISMPTG